MFFNTIQLTKHAKEQIINRSQGDILDRWGQVIGHVGNLVDEQRVLEAVRNKADAIKSASAPEVRVTVVRFSAVVQAPDGSNGDLLVACIDPVEHKIKTVMLQRHEQAEQEDRRKVQYV